MKNALISPNEKIFSSPDQTGVRIAQVVEAGADFPVAPPLFWTECADDCDPNTWWYYEGSCQPKPIPVPTAEENKATAVDKLSATDWTQTSDVSNPTNNPYLMNVAQFSAYRDQVRQVAVNPVSGFIDWPTEPSAQWSS